MNLLIVGGIHRRPRYRPRDAPSSSLPDARRPRAPGGDHGVLVTGVILLLTLALAAGFDHSRPSV
ncbi:hypothetical protein ABZ630_24860, partial [Streptomyces albidoflavus]|uniref:hypothetical protein n=1 Tax=Streptomyces albidoflavus TaxID=1886 RepID=UPI0033D21304